MGTELGGNGAGGEEVREGFAGKSLAETSGWLAPVADLLAAGEDVSSPLVWQRISTIIVGKFGQMADLVGVQQTLKLLCVCGDQQLKAKVLDERLRQGEHTERILNEWRGDIAALEGVRND